ncbi:MAG: hypothetical protein P1U44_10575 [Vicingaceae bacterium]|jgi:hypothetical protein|nr:hypothetical protein [Flavobacteriales bacterium]MBQ21256.1 hypothetical protein [Flavobacteriales bacterium]MDF1676150.1 hypothetical protein [Vicingaceae bacterium]|tara:strand:- start:158895 stop:159269 length:375 start_codon:yes stop_codon:yes gene_type:complete
MKIKSFLKFSFISTLMLGIFVGVSAQNTNKDNGAKSLFNRAEVGSMLTILTDVTAYDENTIGALKDDLSNYHEKIVMIAIDEKSKILKITYTEHMLVEDLQKIFNKHSVTYKPVRKPNIQFEQE